MRISDLKITLLTVMLGLFTSVAACSPTVKVEAPEKPIEINLNVNIEHKVKIEIEKDVKHAISKNPNLF